MDCPDFESIEKYILGHFKAESLAEFEEHLGGCPACSAKVGEGKANEELLVELRTYEKGHAEFSGEGEGKIETTDLAQSVLGEKYRVIRKVGEGSSGQVFQAVDTVLERLVAIKFLRRKSSDQACDEIWREARLMSQLNHPNIAQIFEVGEFDSQRFIVMEWVDGQPLTEAWKELQLQQRLRVYLGVLDAVAAAHRRGIIHRDIKPSNILVTSEPKAKVLDFGIAVEARSLESIERGLYRGTPGYSAPEQVTLPVKVSAATDVFALGILLYQLLTDALPFPQTNAKELFEAIRSDYPELPSALQEKIPIPLQNICLKALEKEPSKRYADAQSLGEDIQRFLRGEKVWSRPSFLTDKIQQEVFYHRQKLKVWHDNELITQKEIDRLENIYERMISPADPSIIESRKLSLSQVCLYLGGWIVVLGSFVLLYKWEMRPYWQPMPALFATALMALFGLTMWRRQESRLAVGFLSTANLLIPIAILLTLGQWGWLSYPEYEWGTESIAQALADAPEGESYLVVGNVQLFISSACWLAFSLFFLRKIRSSIFVIFSVIAFLAWLSVCYIIAGMEDWKPESVSLMYLIPGAGLFVLGVVSDRRRYVQYALPLCVVGLILIVVCLSVLALKEKMLILEWSSLEEAERVMLGFVVNGIIYLCLAGVCRRLGTRLQRTLAQALNWLGPIHILAPLRILDSNDESPISENHQVVYRILLPIASVVFVFGSVARQMKSFFFSGLGGIAASVHKITKTVFQDHFSWPVSLILTGIIWMFVSWLVPRWKASAILKRKD